MKYTVKVTANGAEIEGQPDVYLHFGHHDFDVVFNRITGRHETLNGVHSFYGGMGEGSKYDTWQKAIHASLYDAFQVFDVLKDGDTFEVEYDGESAQFVCEGVHVVRL